MGAAAPALAPILIGGAAVFSAVSSFQQGQAVKREARAQADQERITARDREIKRRRELLKTLASANANAAASGVRLEGSEVNRIEADLSRFDLENRIAKVQTEATIQSIKRTARAKSKSLKIGAVTSLLETGASFSKVGSVPGKTGGTQSPAAQQPGSQISKAFD